jgi:ketosteroid isomerase-like protein
MNQSIKIAKVAVSPAVLHNRPSRPGQEQHMRPSLATTFIILSSLYSTVLQASVAEKDAIAAVLDDFHKAASEANAERYFSHFDEEAVFIGTDAKERWTVSQFRNFATPFFEQGHGWTYLPTRRYITLHRQGSVAWFDELLDSIKYGQIRGSGVMVKTSEGWKISLYDLHFPIPNELTEELTSRIKAYLSGAEKASPAKKAKSQARKETKPAEQEASETVTEDDKE